MCPLQIQGPKSLALMADLVGNAIHEIPYYGLLEAGIAGCPVVISQSSFEVPFRPSLNPSAREVAHSRGEDATI